MAIQKSPVKNSTVHNQILKEQSDNQYEVISMSEKGNNGGPTGHYTESLDEFTNNKTPLRDDNIDLMT